MTRMRMPSTIGYGLAPAAKYPVASPALSSIRNFSAIGLWRTDPLSPFRNAIDSEHC
jgi:hypothetical protein